VTTLLWLTTLASAQAPTCELVGMKDLASIAAPAVLVLGERKGMWPDLIRAERLLHALKREHPVTLAIQAVHPDKQPVLDRYVDGNTALGDLPDLLAFSTHWAHPWTSYQTLISTGETGVDLVALGHEPELRPPEQELPLPPGYVHVMLDAIGEHALPVDLEPRFVQTVAWSDHRMAKTAIEAWDGQGYLVILADRMHVEGGLGISWQASRLTEASVHSVLLANAQTPCYAGDKVWRDHPFDK
jgi:uncharacterized iron-regulated protein